MKPFFLIVFVSSLLASCTSNDAMSLVSAPGSAGRATMMDAASDTANFTSIQWLDSSHQELGKVMEGQVVEVSWHFKNSGTKPLIISNASASCGCTVAEKPEEPVAPGGKGIIKAKFDSHNRQGAQRKDVYVLANTTGVTNHQLSFAVDVSKK